MNICIDNNILCGVSISREDLMCFMVIVVHQRRRCQMGKFKPPQHLIEDKSQVWFSLNIFISDKKKLLITITFQASY